MSSFRSIHISMITAGCMLFFAACPGPLRPPERTIELTADYVSSRVVWLGVRFLNSAQPRNIAIKRDDVLIYSNADCPPVVLIRDTLLTPNRSYSYSAKRFNGPNDEEVVSLPIATPDTTSHMVAWQIDTLGVQGMIRDVWVFDQDNIWAVGEIYLNDSTGQLDGDLYNAAQWNGFQWNVKRISVTLNGGEITPPLDGIFAFSPQQIWCVGSLPIYGDGVNWTIYDVRELTQSTLSVSKGWGANVNSMFFVGRQGSIARFNGNVWTKTESGTTVDLEDIWGVDESHIWATGTNIQDGRSVILFFDGVKWNTYYDNLGKPLNEQYAFGSVWANRSNSLHAIGQSNLRTFALSDFGSPKRWQSPQQYLAFRVRGMDEADMFISGQGSELMHFNGSTWYLYPEIKALESGFSSWWLGISVRQNTIAVGGMKFTGVNSVPMVLRGYR